MLFILTASNRSNLFPSVSNLTSALKGLSASVAVTVYIQMIAMFTVEKNIPKYTKNIRRKSKIFKNTKLIWGDINSKRGSNVTSAFALCFCCSYSLNTDDSNVYSLLYKNVQQ